MNGINDFVSNLGSADRDKFMNLMGVLTSNASPDRLERLDSMLASVKEEIDRKQRYRERISAQLMQAKEVADILDDTDDVDNVLELQLLRIVLHLFIMSLEEDMADSRPFRALKKKAQLVREKDLLTRQSKAADLILEIIKSGK